MQNIQSTKKLLTCNRCPQLVPIGIRMTRHSNKGYVCMYVCMYVCIATTYMYTGHDWIVSTIYSLLINS